MSVRLLRLVHRKLQDLYLHSLEWICNFLFWYHEDISNAVYTSLILHTAS